MTKAILGEKLGMTQIFKEDLVIPVTVLKAGPCVVTQVKVPEKDGYEAIQLGYGDVKPDRVNQPMKGHFKKANSEPQRFLAEVPLSTTDYKPGQKVKVDIFAEGDRADVSGVSKGKGFAGVVKRWGFAGGPASHGARFNRGPGSIGACATPSRVFKGKKMPGRMGTDNVTVQNLLVVGVDHERDLLLLRGAVPGPRGSLLVIRESVKGQKKQSGKR
jgi:large subunit ribosomal protein L3